MKAVFVVEFPPDRNLPPMEDFPGDDYCLVYTDAEGRRCGGLEGCVGNAPPLNGVPTQMVVVDASPEVIARMKADERYLHVENLPDASQPVGG